MKYIFTTLLLLACAHGFAQNYQCFKPDSVQFFLNDNHYLRGIRIDSVKHTTDATVYYPYKTLRGEYWRGLGLAPKPNDSLAGSWVGKEVIQLQDGTFLFDNMWGDTVIIQTQAHKGDSWIFYDGSFNLYFTAQITAHDTMTVLGNLDSVKTILLVAHNKTTGVTEPADGTQIILSKNHGFIRVLDLYTFPYHKPDSAYKNEVDFFVDQTINDIIFDQINFINPTMAELSNWDIGNVLEYEGDIGSMYVWYQADTIINKTQTAQGTTYTIKRGVAAVTRPNLYPSGVDNTTEIINYNTSRFLDPTFFPEQGSSFLSCYYYPNDTSHCNLSPKYVKQYNSGYGATYIYKLGTGYVAYFRPSGDPGYEKEEELIYYNINGKLCGRLYDLAIPSIASQYNITIYPNPANESFVINFDNTRTFNITLINTLGQIVYSINTGQQIQISTKDLPTGLYNVHITDEQNNVTNKRIVIVH